jgi:transcription elongation factor GreA
LRTTGCAYVDNWLSYKNGSKSRLLVASLEAIISSNVTYLTPEGLQKIEKELDYLLTVKRSEVTQHLHDASEYSDVRENNDYFIARDEQSFIEGRIQELKDKLARVKVITSDHSRGIVQIGSTIIVQENGKSSETYRIVGTLEANSTEDLISNESPLGQALLGNNAGDEVEVRAPAGVIKFLIVAVM